MQKKIFDIVAKVVENDFFGIDTSFYKAGLSSISAMKLCVLISEEVVFYYLGHNVKDLLLHWSFRLFQISGLRHRLGQCFFVNFAILG